MKLRIQGNTVRVRLNDKEVAKLAEGQTLNDETQFLSGTLKYVIQPDTASSADFKDNIIRINLETASVSTWYASDQVSISIESATRDEKKLSILVEKDMKV